MRPCFSTNLELVDSLQTDDEVKAIMKRVDRIAFCQGNLCYCDQPSPILVGQTISAPHMHAKAIEYMYPRLKPGSVVLDVGSGSGYLTACFGYLVNVMSPIKKNRGKVIGIEVHKPLVTYSIKKTERSYPDLFTYVSRYKLLKGSGWDGYPKKSTKEIYDAIHVGASADSIPYYLLRQLKIGGIMVLPLKLDDSGGHVFCIISKDKQNNIHIKRRESVRYVPLIRKGKGDHGIQVK